MSDERITWAREKLGRKVVQTIESSPAGFNVITQWVEVDGSLWRQDCEAAVMGVSMQGEVKEM